MRTRYLETGNKQLCCGCRACEQICPPKAISMHIDGEGFIYPAVDVQTCINCGLCSKVCPIDNADKVKQAIGKYYVAVNRNHSELLKSSSGGVFSVIADYVIQNGGVVYGAAFQDGLHLKHIRITKKEDLDKLRGSKYVQSDTADTYNCVRKDLRDGKLVYYVGTGCQVAGLRLFLRKDYNSLILSDLVCHGTPSDKMFHVFVDKLQDNRNLILDDYKFRDKRVNGWSCSSSSSSGSKTIWYDKIMNAYTNAFLSGSINREVCYECPFACGNRTGDITLADYWSVRKHHPSIDYQFGVSCIAVNTEKGKKIIETLSKEIILEKSKYEWAIDENHNLEGKTPRPKERTTAYEEAFSHPNEFIRKFVDKDDVKKHILFTLKRMIKSNERLYQFLRTVKKKIRP